MRRLLDLPLSEVRFIGATRGLQASICGIFSLRIGDHQIDESLTILEFESRDTESQG
ncbi:MAG: hypothetical protein MUC92_05925 [Fimbriimonadaceae bacterium]|nr:hypothetical protein [Fimbriimonadaceae bacterium]